MAFCEGCHGEIGATTDGTFSFARQLVGDTPARGWFHFSQHDLHGVPEPRSANGDYEYARYLSEVGAGDELRENGEIIERFFDTSHALRKDAVARLHEDIAYLLLPSRERAIQLDRAYRAIVQMQAFDKGRDALVRPALNVYSDVPLGHRTGIADAVTARPIRATPASFYHRGP